MSPYASGTSVPVERSKAELERLLVQHSATRFASGWEERMAVVTFTLDRRIIRFNLPLPTLDQVQSRRGGKTAAMAKVEQLHRERWRALLLAIKSKLVAVEAGIETIEQAFMAHVVMPDNRTIHETVGPLIERAYCDGKMPLALLPAGGGA